MQTLNPRATMPAPGQHQASSRPAAGGWVSLDSGQLRSILALQLNSGEVPEQLQQVILAMTCKEKENKSLSQQSELLYHELVTTS